MCESFLTRYSCSMMHFDNVSRVARYEAETYQDDPEDVMMLVSSSRRIEDYINSILEAH